MGIDDFKGCRPEFLPEDFLDGQLEGWAVLESPVGGLQKRATIAAEGKWDAGSQTVRFTETYTFDDGHTDTLNWIIRREAVGQYSGRSHHSMATRQVNRLAVRSTGNIRVTCRRRTALQLN
jgi:hypothetical protein